jgi:phosphoglucosamine mutase
MGKLFGTDGIRGVVGEWPMVPEFFFDLGSAVGEVLRNRFGDATIVVGRDTRRSGEVFQISLTAGLLAAGIDVIDLGVIPTSGIAYLVRKIGTQSGAIISASHNPVNQNGIKFFDISGYKMPESLEDEVESRLGPQYTYRRAAMQQQPGRYFNGIPYHQLYIQGLLAEHEKNFLNGLTILDDCSNGAASQIAPQVFSQAGARTITIHASPDGNNINFNCGSEFVRRAPEEMGVLIHQLGANFGLALDGDADRVVFIDELGNLIDGDHMIGFLSRYLDQKGQLLARSVVTTQMRNAGLKAFVEADGMTLYETPVGDKYVAEKIIALRQQHGETGKFGLGGEQAGHIDILNDEFTTGDGIRTALFVMKAYKESHADSMANFAAGIRKTPQIIASAFVGNGPRYDKDILSGMENQLLSGLPGLMRVNLRYSGTEPLLRIMMESDGGTTEMDLARLAWDIGKQAQGLAGVDEGMIDILNCTRGGVITPQPGW